MTTSSTVNSSRQLGNGVTVNFSANIKVFAETDIVVQILNRTTSAVVSTLILNDAGSDGYTVSYSTSDENLTVTVNTAPTSTQDILIYRDVPVTQGTAFPVANKFPSSSVENALDRLTVVSQDSQANIGRSLKVAISDTSVNSDLPSVSGNAGDVIVINSGETGFEYRTLLDSDTITNFSKETFSGNGSNTDFTLSQAPSVINALEVYEIVSGVNERKQPLVDFTVSGTTLTFSTAPASGTNNVWVIDTATTTTAQVPSDGSVTNVKLDKSVITGQTDTVITASDVVLFSDVTDGGLLKKDTVQGILDLVPTTTNVTLGTSQATTSGTSIDFTSIPSGVKKIIVSFVGVSTNGTDRYVVQLGDSGGIETTGYAGSTQANGVTGSVWSEGFVAVQAPIAAGTYSGSLILTLVDAATFTWAGNVNVSRTDSPDAHYGGGSKVLSAELDRLRITTSAGTNTFDAGLVNIQYES